MKICFWVPQGRLGNLIFQYQAVRRLCGNGRVIAPDSEYFDLFERPPRVILLRCPRVLRRRFQRLWCAVLQWFAGNKWIGTAEPQRSTFADGFTGESGDVAWTDGRLRSICMIRGFFQSPQYLEPMPRIKQKYMDAAEQRLAGIGPECRVAIHVRLGDYARWPVFGIPGAACLPASYYARAMSIVESSVEDPHYLLFSDDPEHALRLLADERRSRRFEVIGGGSAETDFAAMASCSHAIVSASSFAWWAAMLIKNPHRILIGPEFWAGFRKETWYPPGIRSDQFTYVPLAEFWSGADDQG